MTQHHAQPTWMIVGALSDLGRATAWQMAQKGIQLLLTDQDQEALFVLADEIEARGYPAPLLIAIDLAHLEAGSHQLTEQLTQLSLSLTGWVWTGYHLKSPMPMLYISLADWQTELTTNLTYPYWLLRASIHAQAINQQTQVWFAVPQTQAFTHAMGLSSLIWEELLSQLRQELGDTAPIMQLWHLPKLADRVHRRIWPLSPVEDFVLLDEVVVPWLDQITSATTTV
jgi:NAD(P)-dependent dehydrogenase (short-subunit alcohol dehydrogenase family)